MNGKATASRVFEGRPGDAVAPADDEAAIEQPRIDADRAERRADILHDTQAARQQRVACGQQRVPATRQARRIFEEDTAPRVDRAE